MSSHILPEKESEILMSIRICHFLNLDFLHLCECFIVFLVLDNVNDIFNKVPAFVTRFSA